MRLSKNKIYQIVMAADQGRGPSQIAKEFSVDSSTVRYHVELFENTYGSTSAVYSLIPKPKACNHPSSKCLVCGQAWDQVHRRELEEIMQLKHKLQRAEGLLSRFGYTLD